MLRAADEDTSFLLVESDDDYKLMSNFINNDLCEIHIAWNRDKAIKAIRAIKNRGIAGVVCLIDADYSHILGDLPTDADIIYPDERDIEMMMLNSPAMDRIITELSSPAKIKRAAGLGYTPASIVFSAAKFLGIMRIISLKKEIHFSFESFKFKSFDRRTVNYSEDDVINELFSCSQKKVEKLDVIKECVQEIMSSSISHTIICSGHDAAELLGRSLVSLFGTNNSTSVNREEIESKLRIAFSDDMFANSSLYPKFKKWESGNSPFICLRF